MTDYSAPHEVSDVQMAFPANLGELLPPYDEDLQKWERSAKAKPFLDFANTWFSRGLGPDTTMVLKDGIDGALVLRHLKTIMGSFEPKHEHKIAGVGWLLSQWCENVTAVPPTERV